MTVLEGGSDRWRLGQGYLPAVDRWQYLALAPVPDRETDLLRAAAASAGIRSTDLQPRWWEAEVGSPGTAWRVPTGAAALSAWRGRPLDLAAVPAAWLARRPTDLLGGRRLAVITVGGLLQGDMDWPVRFLKPAALKVRGFPAQQVPDLDGGQAAVRAAGLPSALPLLIADAWLVCESEYRTFCIDRQVVASSPYRIQDEGWSPELGLHRASWHEEAAEFVGELLAGLPGDDVPPACVLDVARLPSGEFAIVEANTSWAAGLYGCDPDAVLQAVLAAQQPTDERWRFDPGEPLTFVGHA